MVRRTKTFAQLQPSYLFVEIHKRVQEFKAANPGVDLISFGIGDTSEPLHPLIVNAIKKHADGMGTREGYFGYSEYNGSSKLRNLLCEKVYNSKVEPDEIFISDGSKPDLARLQFLFGPQSSVAIQNPTYPVYIDGTIISGKVSMNATPSNDHKVVLMKCSPENDFFPDFSQLPRTDVIYFCSPNNPTGAVATRQQLTELVRVATENKSIILYDAAYSSFIRDTDTYPRTIFEIPGAEKVAIETNSFSKSLGFTGVRLGWTVCPKALKFEDGHSVRDDWARIMGTFFNGPSNFSEAGAIAALESDVDCIKETTDYYLENAKLIAQGLKHCPGLTFTGGVDSPYIWAQAENKSSWDLFRDLLENCHIVVTPGQGFGSEGESFIRFSAFAHRENVIKGVEQLKTFFQSSV